MALVSPDHLVEDPLAGHSGTNARASRGALPDLRRTGLVAAPGNALDP